MAENTCIAAPMGLTCFVSPIFSEEMIEAKITVGPFLMVDASDYLYFDGRRQLHLEQDAPIAGGAGARHMCRSLTLTASRSCLNLLFMAVGFINNVSDANRMLARQGSVTMQVQITAYILQLKHEHAASAPYPLETEEAFLSAVRQVDRDTANRLLNELLGYIFFSTGGELSKVKNADLRSAGAVVPLCHPLRGGPRKKPWPPTIAITRRSTKSRILTGCVSG